MDIYEVIFVAYDDNCVVNFYNNDLFSSYEKAKEYVDSCVDANLSINKTTLVNLMFGMNSKNNIRHMPVGFGGKSNDILYGVQTMEQDIINHEKIYYMDRFVVKKIIYD